MLEGVTSNQVIAIATTGLFLVGLAQVILKWTEVQKRNSVENRPSPTLFSTKESPVIQATNGVPSFQQLTNGIQTDPKRMGFAERLYESGLAQFNRYVNNRDAVIEESRREMTSLTSHLSQTEVSLAGTVGKKLATDINEEQKVATQKQYLDLSPQGQILAQHKRNEIDALRTIARDLEKNVPRTDYTSVKERIASGNAPLDSIVSELPISWQDIRNLNDRVERPRFTEKPEKREFLHVMFITGDKGLLEDKRAEKDGDWIISDRHNMMVPYQKPVPRSQLREFGKPPVQIGEVVIVNQDPSSEWETEFWRQGGRLDQVYLRAKRGMSPDQLWSAYRRRLIRRAVWTMAGVMTIVDVAIIIAKFL